MNAIENKLKEMDKKDPVLLFKVKEMRKQLRKMHSKLPIEKTTYRRFAYTRYADDWIVTFTGTFDEAKQIMNSIRIFLKNSLNLELSDEKCFINKANKVQIRFLGYNIITQWDNNKISNGRYRALTGQIGFLVPQDVIIEKRRKYTSNGKPIHLPYRLQDSVFDIIRMYQQELIGFSQYYKFARNQKDISTVKFYMQVSLVKTIAAKLKISAAKVYKRFKGTKIVDNYTYKVLCTTIASSDNKREYTAYFGAIPLKRKIAIDSERIKDKIFNTNVTRVSLSCRLQNNVCELCGATEDIEIHHIHHLKDIKNNKSEYAKKMIAMNRKTLAVCKKCHVKIHNGTYDGCKLR